MGVPLRVKSLRPNTVQIPTESTSYNKRLRASCVEPMLRTAGTCVVVFLVATTWAALYLAPVLGCTWVRRWVGSESPQATPNVTRTWRWTGLPHDAAWPLYLKAPSPTEAQLYVWTVVATFCVWVVLVWWLALRGCWGACGAGVGETAEEFQWHPAVHATPPPQTELRHVDSALRLHEHYTYGVHVPASNDASADPEVSWGDEIDYLVLAATRIRTDATVGVAVCSYELQVDDSSVGSSAAEDVPVAPPGVEPCATNSATD